MRIVMIYQVSDGYTYSYDVVLPIIYDSPEQAAVDFEDLARKFAYKGGKFKFDNEEFHCSDFISSRGGYESPKFLTIDEWFTQEANNRVL